MEKEKMLLIIYVAYLIILSFISFCAYGIDKKRAIKGKRRIPEKTLLSASLLGGAFGGLLGMLRFRHKTTMEHWYFSVTNIVGIIVHTVLVIYLFTLI